MAGIGFELKKLFAGNSILLKMRANLFSGMVVAGPMIMGAVLLLGVKFLAVRAGATLYEQDLLIVTITYALLFSLLLINVLSYVLSRFVADMVYAKKYEPILPSLYGSISILMVIGAPPWAYFLSRSSLPFQYNILIFTLFCLGIVVWTQISYITDIKQYKTIIYGFAGGITLGLLAGFLLTQSGYETIPSLLGSVCIGYGLIMTAYAFALHRHFPGGGGKPMEFLKWIRKFPTLPFVGFFTTSGLFVHLMLMWRSPLGAQVEGLFYHAPVHDIPALFGFFTILVTSINFVTSLEVNFYPKYRLYFDLLNEGGTLKDIEKAREEMLTVLKQELLYLALRQIFVTIAAVVFISQVLMLIGLGFTSTMIGLFRVLCIGYAFYAVANTMLLYLLYFSADKLALYPALVLFSANTAGTMISMNLPQNYYGFGFVFAAFSMFLAAWICLVHYTRHIEYYVFCLQPVFVQSRKRFFTRMLKRKDPKNLADTSSTE